MASLLLAVIYAAFISLGLPDSLLGSAWPVMQQALDVPLSYAGVVTMIITGGTIVSSLLSDRAIHRFGTGIVTAVSVAMTAVALFGFSVSTAFWALCVWAIPYGLGAGAIDAALNNYVALHYSSRHMSWLHAFWGIGVSVSPYIMSFCLTRQYGWEAGYRSVSVIQAVLTVFLFLTLGWWKKVRHQETDREDEVAASPLSLSQAIKVKGVPQVLLAFFGYCALETTAGLWATTYMVEYRQIDAETAARFAALFYLGITAGRLLNGFVADRFGDKVMIRVGTMTQIAGVILVALPLSTSVAALCGLVIIGLGSAPIYPCIIHSTPRNFGREYSQSLVGIQMAVAYAGSTLAPPIFGAIAQYVHIGLYPLYLGSFAVLMWVMTERLNRIVEKR